LAIFRWWDCDALMADSSRIAGQSAAGGPQRLLHRHVDLRRRLIRI
jgi:hypothetical protein